MPFHTGLEVGAYVSYSINIPPRVYILLTSSQSAVFALIYGHTPLLLILHHRDNNLSLWSPGLIMIREVQAQAQVRVRVRVLARSTRTSSNPAVLRMSYSLSFYLNSDSSRSDDISKVF
jgi:hypothetical protein